MVDLDQVGDENDVLLSNKGATKCRELFARGRLGQEGGEKENCRYGNENNDIRNCYKH